ncbi:MAG: winged helix-turn-helix transcriptional regulator [Chloroflexi bacterium]|nr:winged helix-turn-helix transcriptional regulator [Chloroflexota bacterium]
MFAALCDRTRQRILLLLDERERSVNELVQQFNLSQPTISRHLQVLRRAGLVKARREGQQVVYSIDGESMGGCLADFCSGFACCAPFFGSKGAQAEARAEGKATS